MFLQTTVGARSLKRQVAHTATPTQLHIIFNQPSIPAMPNNNDISMGSKIIRWTDDEWAQIASHLYTQVGLMQFESSAFKELRAKDVFLAQRVLPGERHRKLVSIAQGFGGIRKKLGAVLQGISQHRQQDLVLAGRLGFEEGERVLQNAVSGHDQASRGYGPLVKAESRADETEQTVFVAPLAASTGLVTDAAKAVQASHTVDLIRETGERVLEQTPEPKNGRTGQSGYMPHRALATTRKLDTVPGSLNLIETARPFIAMVCEVFVEAVIDVISAKTPEHALTVGKRNNFGQPAATQQASHDESYSVGRQADACHDSPIQSRFNTVEGQSEPSRIAALPGDYPADTDEVEVDVQPLFDPKLPPSAGSEFKPKIGLVSKHADEFKDLQRLYPQLDLTILQANTIADVRRFGHCQRIIALRDDLLPSTDDLLAEQLRHRYVRLSGGLSALKSQLNAWLQMPGSIKAPSGRTGPRNSDASSGGITQKKQNRYPRMIGR